MPRSVILLLVLAAAGIIAGVTLTRHANTVTMNPTVTATAPRATTAPVVAPAPTPPTAPDLSGAASAMSSLAPEAPATADAASTQDPSQVKVLKDQVAYLEQQVQALQKENSQLLDKLSSITRKPGTPMPESGAMTSPPCEQPTRMPTKEEPDFVGIGIDLVKLRGIQDIPIPTVTVPRAEVEKHIAKWLSTQAAPDHGTRQGRALAALGAIPEPVDTMALKASFLTHQIGGWYDPSEQTMFLAQQEEGGINPTDRENALALSYGYLLKHFGPTLYPSGAKITTLDARLSRDCLISGDAALVRFLHALQDPAKGGGGGVGEDPDDPSRAVPIPNFLRELELLPFQVGFDFMQSMHSIGGWEQVNATYKRPPIAGAEALDPQVYLNETPFALQPIEFTDVKIGSADPLWQDTMGPMATVVMLKQRVPEPIATDTATGWANDKLLIYAADGKPRDHAVWQTLCRSSDAADALFSAMRQWLQGKYKTAKAPANTPANAFQLENEDRFIHLQRTNGGKGVLLIDAADSAFAQSAIAKFGMQ